MEDQRSIITKELLEVSSKKLDSSKKLIEAKEFMFQTAQYFTQTHIVQKQQLVSSIFPEKLIYDGEKVRTPRVNEVLRPILLKTNEKCINKKG